MIEAKLAFFALLSVIAAFLAYIGIDEKSFSIFLVLLIMDYITGLFKARAVGERITSNKMKYGIASKLSLLLVPIVLGLGATALNQQEEVSKILYWGISVLILSEVYSVIGNISAIRTGVELPEIDVISNIAKKIRHFIGGNEDK